MGVMTGALFVTNQLLLSILLLMLLTLPPREVDLSYLLVEISYVGYCCHHHAPYAILLLQVRSQMIEFVVGLAKGSLQQSHCSSGSDVVDF
jgi:hypothetical protein